MVSYVIKRLLLVLPTIFFVTLIIFIAIRLIPGNVVDIMAANNPTTRLDTKELIEERLGLNLPIHIQYGHWVGILPDDGGDFDGLLQGNFGRSLWTNQPVVEMIQTAWPVTLQLGLMGILIGVAIAIPIGVLSAIRDNTWLDYVARSIAILALAIPPFWLGTMLIVFPSIWFGIMPPIRYVYFFDNPVANISIMALPALVLGLEMTGTTMRLTRASMLEVLKADYIRTAWAKGLRERTIVTRHALKNAVIPVITLIGGWFGVVIGGTIIIEQVFSLPGLGRLIVSSALTRDYPVISGLVVMFGIGMVLINLVVDLIYTALDPRIKPS